MTKPVEQQSNQLGSIEFDWFLVRFRSIDFAGSKCLNLIMGGGGGGELLNFSQGLGANSKVHAYFVFQNFGLKITLSLLPENTHCKSVN